MSEKPISEVEWLKLHHANQAKNSQHVDDCINSLKAMITALAAPLQPAAFNAVMQEVERIERIRPDASMGRYATFLRLEELGWAPNENHRFGAEYEPWVRISE